MMDQNKQWGLYPGNSSTKLKSSTREFHSDTLLILALQSFSFTIG